MGFAILRTAKIKDAGSAGRSLKHAYRTQNTPNADPLKTPKNEHLRAKTFEEAKSRFHGLLPDKRRKNAVLAVEYLITGSPEDMAGKSQKQQDAYFSDALKWLEERHGAENIFCAGVHRDESTPHMYAYVVPLDPDTGRLNCRRWLGGAKALSEMQTDFAERVGLKHGLKRGMQNSRAKHQTIQKYYAAAQKSELELAKQHEALAQSQGDFSIEPDELKALCLEKGFFKSSYETPEMIAKRLSDKARAYQRAIQEQAKETLKLAETYRRRGLSDHQRLGHIKGVNKQVADLQIRLDRITGRGIISEDEAAQLTEQIRFQRAPKATRRQHGMRI